MKKIIEHLKDEWYKYLMEILVLIIGIYGAFMVDNWNINRLETKKAENYKEELVKELNKGEQHIIYCIAFHKNEIKLIKALRTEYQLFNNTEKLRSMIIPMHDSVRYKLFDPPRVVINNLLESGSLEHLPKISGSILELANTYDQTGTINYTNIQVTVSYQNAYNMKVDPIALSANKPSNYTEHALVADWTDNKDSEQYLLLIQWLSRLEFYHNRNLEVYPPILEQIRTLRSAIN